jgi:polyisoprenoid-binding protein YceI
VFEIAEVTPASGEQVNIKGHLVIKGIMNEINFPVTVRLDETTLEAEASFSFDRSKWNVRYRSKSFFSDLGDKFLYDDVDVKLHLTAKT